MSWEYFLVDVLMRSGIGVMIGIVLFATFRFRTRGTWVLNPQAEPHVCRTPNRPRRDARRWLCNTCGTLHEARGITLMGSTVWVWEEVNPETDMTERQELKSQVDSVEGQLWAARHCAELADHDAGMKRWLKMIEDQDRSRP